MPQFTGSIPALVTPFNESRVDFAAFEQLVEWQIESGSHGLVPCGTTGETPTLTDAEYKSIVETCVRTVGGRIPVIVGAGSNATTRTVELARFAEKAGADGILVVTPYYNKPTQEGMYRHFRSVSDAVGIPIIIYNVPSRTGVEISVDTVLRLSELPAIAGIKDASTDLSRPLQMREALGDDFALLSGEDTTVAAYLAQGGHGCITVTGNVAPRQCADLHNFWQKKNWKNFERLRDQLSPLHKALFLEPNPAPVKYCLSRLGRCMEDVRLPLMPVSTSTRRKLDEAMARADLMQPFTNSGAGSGTTGRALKRPFTRIFGRSSRWR